MSQEPRATAGAAPPDGEADFRAMFELAGVGQVQADPVTGRFLRVNHKQCEITGYSAEELLARTFSDITHPDDRERDLAQFRRMVRGEIPAESIEKRYVRKDGTVVWVHVTATVVRDAHGRPLRSVGIVQDINERKKTEEALRRSEERFRQLTDNVPHGFVYQIVQAPDNSLRFTHVSAGVEALTGLTPAEATADPAAMYGQILPEDLPHMRAAEEEAFLQRKPFDFQFRLRTRRGELRWLHCRSAPRPLPDGGFVWDGIAIDVTAHKRAEEALREADRRKDEFLAMLAHELRNPLAPIRNSVQVLKLLGLPDARLELARDMIDRQVTHLARLVDDLLDVSRITRGKILLRKERLDLVPLVRSAVEDHRALLEGTGLELSAQLPNGPVSVAGDPTRLAQVVGNLLHNANKFTDAGGRVSVRLEADGGAAVLSVRDTGIGMDADMLARLFEPFSQADRSLARSRGGLGLGLALVKGLAELHGGGVRASSPGAGWGSEFVVRLPLADAGAGAARLAGAAAGGGPSLRVLIIEDNHDTAESLRLMLTLSGHEAAVAYTGRAGLEAARGFRPEVVLCDIGLPGGMDGYAIARALRADPELFRVVAVALSGYGQEEDQRKARQAGFDHHLTKPARPEELERVLAGVTPQAR